MKNLPDINTAFDVAQVLAHLIEEYARYYPYNPEAKAKIDGYVLCMKAAKIFAEGEEDHIKMLIEEVEKEAPKIQYILKETNVSVWCTGIFDNYYNYHRQDVPKESEVSDGKA